MAIQTDTNRDINLIKYGTPYVSMAKTSTGKFVYPNYSQDGLLCWLDGQINSRSGQKDDSVTVWEDLSGNGNDFTVTGMDSGYTNNIWWTTGDTNSLNYSIRGLQPRYLGANTKIYKDINTNFPDPFTTSAWTMEFLVYPTTLRNYLTLFRTITDSNYREAWVTSAGAISMRVYNNTSVTASSALAANKFYTVALTRSGTTGSQTNKIYVNGVQKTSTATSQTSVSVSRLFIFSRNANQYNFNGYVFGFRFYNRALTADELLANYKIDRIRFDSTLNDPTTLYPNQHITTLSATCTQGNGSYGTQVTTTLTAPSNAAQICINNFACGISYGSCETILIHY